MRTRTALIAAGLGAVAVVAAGGVAAASSDDGDGVVRGPQAGRAMTAALDATGGGRANSVERDGENGATWEVEVTTKDGDTVDVRLDGNYRVVVIEGDSEAQ
jgi:hypothetical protein